MDEWDELDGFDIDLYTGVSDWGAEEGVERGDKKLWISIK